MSRALYAETLESPFELPTVDPDEYDPDEDPDEDPEEEPEIYGADDFGNWRTTPEQRRKIAAGDWRAVSDFLRDNAEKLLRMACRYARGKNQICSARGLSRLYEPDEMISQLYIDLPLLDWTDGKRLYWSVRLRSFVWCPFGGYAQRKAAGLPCRPNPWNCGYFDSVNVLDEPLPEFDGRTFGDTLEADPEERPDIAAALTEVKHLTAEEITAALSDMLSPRELQVLPELLKGRDFNDLQKEIGLCSRNKTVYNNLLEKLRRNYVAVLERLQAAGMEIPKEHAGTVPEGYKEAVERYEARKRQKREYAAKGEKKPRKKPNKELAAARSRAWYARNREKVCTRNRQRYAERAGGKTSAGA